MLILYAIAGTSGLYLNTLLEIIVGRAFLGIAVGGIMTIAVALIGDYFEGAERLKTLGLQAGVMALSGTVFISAGGALADISWRYPFLIYGLALLAVPLVFIYLKEPQKAKQEVSLSKKQATIPKTAWIVYILSFLGMAVFYMMPVQIPFFIKSVDSSVSNGQIGLSLALTMLVAGTASFNFQRIKARLTHFQIYGVSFLVMGLGYFAVSYATSYLLVFPGLIIAGAGAGLIMPNSNLCLVTLASPEARGRALGMLTTFIFLGQFLSPLMFQPIIDFTSITEGFFFLSTAMILIATISLIRNRKQGLAKV